MAEPYVTAIRTAANGMGKISRDLDRVGLDAGYLTEAAAAIQLIAGIGQAMAGLTALCGTYSTLKAAEGLAQAAKFGVGAPLVLAGAVAAGYAVGDIIDSYTGDYSTDEGRRKLAQAARA